MFAMWFFLFVVWNVISFVLFGIDKLCAVLQTRRIPENLLIALAFFMGGIGAGIGMLLFRHKIKKPKFYLLIPFAFVINIALLLGIYYGIVWN